MTEESVRQTVRAAETRERVQAARRVLTGPRPEGVIAISLATAAATLASAFFGRAHHDAVMLFGAATLGVGLLLGAALLKRPHPPETIERALRDLAQGSDRADLRALVTFVRRQDWSSQETARLTANYLPMARRAIERGRGSLPTGLARWIGTLQEGGVVSEDLDEIARRIDASQGS